MSDDGKRPPKGKKPDRFRVVKHPNAAKPTADQVRQLYMASTFVEWGPFAESMRWDDSMRGDYPVAEWIRTKRELFARRQAEAIGDAVFHHRSRWHQDVLKTLKEYPEAHDAMLGVLKARINDVIGTINEDQQNRAIAAQTGLGYTSKFAQIKNGDLAALAIALRTVTDAKHKSLMIGDWSFKVAETFSDPRQFAGDEEKAKNLAWTVEIIGGEKLTSAQLQELLGKWYDKPMMPHTPAQVAAAAGDGTVEEA